MARCTECNDGRQHSGKEAAGISATLRQLAADTGDRKPNLKQSRQAESEKEKQQRHAGDEIGRLKLKSPAEMMTARAQDQQQRNDRPEGHQNSQRIHRAVSAQPLALVTRRLHQRQPLDEQHRKHTRHQVQNQPAKKCQPQNAQQSAAPLYAGTERSVAYPVVIGDVN